jgi:hypothetical protein
MPNRSKQAQSKVARSNSETPITRRETEDLDA